MSKRQALGQHFLKSTKIAESIADFAKIRKSDIVLEVGTGMGILTPLLCTKAKSVISVEKDPVLYGKAKTRFAGWKNLVLEQGDAFSMDLVFDVLVSNLPYSESRNAVEWLVQRNFSHAVVMFQKEFAQKLLAKQGRCRKAVSVLAGYCLQMAPLMDVGADSFQPAPKVASTIMLLKHEKTVSGDLVAAVNRLFSFRRKSVRNVARQFGIQIDSGKRLEDLSDSEIIEIAKKIVK